MIQVIQGFNPGVNEPIDGRILLSYDEMRSVNDNVMPNTYFAIGRDDGLLYIYKKSHVPTEFTGKFTVASDFIDRLYIRDADHEDDVDITEQGGTVDNKKFAVIDLVSYAKRDLFGAVVNLNIDDNGNLTATLFNDKGEPISTSEVVADLAFKTYVDAMNEAELQRASSVEESLSNRISVFEQDGDHSVADVEVLVDNLTANLDIEIKNRENSDTSIINTLNLEKSTRESADAGLREDLNKEVVDRGNLDTKLSNLIAAESSRASESEHDLSERINAEVLERTSLITELDTKLSNEITERVLEDTELQSSLSVESSVREETDTLISQNLSQEISDRELHDNELSTRITNVVNDLSVEVQRASSAEATISEKVAEHTNNKNNPHVVTKEQLGLGNVNNTSDNDKPISVATQTAIDAERIARESADLDLGARITSTQASIPTNVSALTNDAGYLTQHQDISYLATKTALQAVEDKIPSLSGYATQQWVENKQYLTTHQDISMKADTTYVDEKDAGVRSWADDKFLTEHQDISMKADQVYVIEQDNILKDLIDIKQDNLIAGENVKISSENIISADIINVTDEEIVVKKDMGGYKAGDIIDANTPLLEILKNILSPITPAGQTFIYWNTLSEVPTSIDSTWTEEESIEGVLLSEGAVHYFTTSGQQYEAFAYKKSLGELQHIYQNDLESFDLISDFSKIEVLKDSESYYIYYSTDTAKESNAKYKFLW